MTWRTIALGCIIGSTACATAVEEDGTYDEATSVDSDDDASASPPQRPPAAPQLPPMSEEAACERIADAVSERALELSCWVTMRTCPNLLRVEYGEACLLYDHARVASCVDTIAVSDVCGQLVELPCGDLAVADSAPQGCTSTPE